MKNERVIPAKQSKRQFKKFEEGEWARTCRPALQPVLQFDLPTAAVNAG